MNRPNISEYDDIREYCLQLDLYCDELKNELENARLTIRCLEQFNDDCIHIIEKFEDEVNKLEKALDKACKELSEFSLCPNGFYEDFKTSDIKCGTSEICDFIHEKGKCWKEWLLKDE